MRNKLGISTVEAMLIVASIGIFGNLLAPELLNSRNKTQQAICAANLKQCGIATLMYVQDYNGFLPPNANPYVPNAAPGVSPWEVFLVYKCKYIPGDVCFCPSQPPDKFVSWKTYGSFPRDYVKLEQLPEKFGKDYGKIIILCDSLNTKDPKQEQTWVGTGYAPWAATHCRHDKRANCLFADGHVEALNKSELLQLLPSAKPEYIVEK